MSQEERKGKGKEVYVSALSFWRWSTNLGHCKLKLTIIIVINGNQVKRWFFEESGTRVRENLSVQSREPTNSKHIIMTPTLGIEPRPHWWEASAFTTASSLHPTQKVQAMIIYAIFFFLWGGGGGG